LRTAEGRVTPGWTAGRCKSGSPPACPVVWTVEDRVAARVEASVASGRPAADRVTPKLTAGGPVPGSPLLSTASPRSHHLLDVTGRLQ
jgi:hypothetical protein